MSGLYVIQHPVGSWNDVVAMLQRADFYHLELSNSHPPKGATVSIHVDGPRNQIIVFRCHRAVAVFGGDVYDDSTPAWTRFVELVGGLDKLVAKLPWKPRNTKPSLSNVERAFLP